MGLWLQKIKIKHLFTDDTEHGAIQKSMNAVADVLQGSCLFPPKLIQSMRKIPKGDDIFSPQDYANKILNRMYDHADTHHIWIE